MTTAKAAVDELIVVACMCGATLRVASSLLGGRVKCKRCGAMARVARGSATAPQRSGRVSEPRTIKPKNNVTKNKGLRQRANFWAGRIAMSIFGLWMIVALESLATPKPSHDTSTALPDVSEPQPQAAQSFYSPPTGVDTSNFSFERTKLQNMESEVTDLDITLDSRRSELESMASRLRLMESESSSDPFGEYETLRNRYNSELEDFNSKVRERNYSADQYTTSRDAFNSRIDEYNSGLRH
jgi:ElaB/YqjD/DUF883 family membrane-anchored ribosome-binding protein